jgi:hypothetical protein
MEGSIQDLRGDCGCNGGSMGEGMSMDIDELVKWLRDHGNEGVTQSDRYHLREEAADALLALHRHAEAMADEIATDIEQGWEVMAHKDVLDAYRAEFPRKP